jgi:tetraacyldisaccharide 4'-kinase
VDAPDRPTTVKQNFVGLAQHRQLHRDLDLVLIDATQPFGFGRVLPRGLLREPVENLRRAHEVIVTRAEGEPAALDAKIFELTGRRPLAHATEVWHGWRKASPSDDRLLLDEGPLPVEALGKARVFGLCGIGNPAAFERHLRRQVGALAGFRAWPDHHAYTEQDLRVTFEDASRAGAEAIALTAKDWVKWSSLAAGAMAPGNFGSKPPNPPIGASLPVYWPMLGLSFREGEGVLDEVLRRVLASESAHALSG